VDLLKNRSRGFLDEQGGLRAGEEKRRDYLTLGKNRDRGSDATRPPDDAVPKRREMKSRTFLRGVPRVRELASSSDRRKGQKNRILGRRGPWRRVRGKVRNGYIQKGGDEHWEG